MDRDILYKTHILECVERLTRYTTGKSFEDFAADELLQDGVARELEILGEAARRLSDSAKSEIQLPWVEISGMRNKIAHDYFELDLEIVRKAATEDVREVERALGVKRGNTA